MKVVPGGMTAAASAVLFHRGDDGGEARAGWNDVELFVVLKEHLEVFDRRRRARRAACG